MNIEFSHIFNLEFFFENIDKSPEMRFTLRKIGCATPTTGIAKGRENVLAQGETLVSSAIDTDVIVVGCGPIGVTLAPRS